LHVLLDVLHHVVEFDRLLTDSLFLGQVVTVLVIIVKHLLLLTDLLLDLHLVLQLVIHGGLRLTVVVLLVVDAQRPREYVLFSDLLLEA
jgi:type IV secretory pathway VirB3-like protein